MDGCHEGRIGEREGLNPLGSDAETLHQLDGLVGSWRPGRVCGTLTEEGVDVDVAGAQSQDSGPEFWVILASALAIAVSVASPFAVLPWRSASSRK